MKTTAAIDRRRDARRPRPPDRRRCQAATRSRCTQLAQAHKIASTGFASTDDAVGSGTLTFCVRQLRRRDLHRQRRRAGEVGDDRARPEHARRHPRRRQRRRHRRHRDDRQRRLAPAATGSSSRRPPPAPAMSLKVSVADDDGTHTDTAGLSRLAYDPAAAVGAGGTWRRRSPRRMRRSRSTASRSARRRTPSPTRSRASRCNLAKANPDATTTLTVATDTSGVSKSVAGFVKAYNDLQTTVSNLTKYDVANKKAAVLTGDTAPRIVQSQLRQILGDALTGSGLSLKTLSQVGVAFKADGTLGLDTAKLDAAIDPRSRGRSPASSRRRHGRPTASISVASTGTKPCPAATRSTSTQLATRGNAVGSVAAGLTITAGVNDILSVTIDGIAADVTLAGRHVRQRGGARGGDPEQDQRRSGAVHRRREGERRRVARRAHADLAAVRLRVDGRRHRQRRHGALRHADDRGRRRRRRHDRRPRRRRQRPDPVGRLRRRHRRPGHHRRRRRPRCPRRHRLHPGLRVEGQPGAHEPPRQRRPGHGQHRGHHQAHRGPQRPARRAEGCGSTASRPPTSRSSARSISCSPA